MDTIDWKDDKGKSGIGGASRVYKLDLAMAMTLREQIFDVIQHPQQKAESVNIYRSTDLFSMFIRLSHSILNMIRRMVPKIIEDALSKVEVYGDNSRHWRSNGRCPRRQGAAPRCTKPKMPVVSRFRADLQRL